MQDKVLYLLIAVPVIFIIMILATMMWVSGPGNPIASIPKVIFDNTDGETIVTVSGVGEKMYDTIFINYTVGNETINVSGSNRYFLDVNVSAESFTLNVTAISGDDHYMLNCTVRVETVSSNDPYLWIQEEEDNSASRHRSPYTILAEWRDIE
jgi:hypothetical protein